MFAIPNITSDSRYSQHHLRIVKMNQHGWIKSGYFSTCKFIHNNICIVMSLKGDFNFVIPWHLLKAINKSTKAPSQYSISAPKWKLRHSRIRSGNPDLTENVVLNAVFINRGCQLTLYHNIPKTGLMLHYTRDVQITGYPCIDHKAPDKNDIHRSLQNCGSSAQNLLYAILLASRSSRWLLDLSKYVDPCIILTFCKF
jgi:hypothetical protein